MSIKHLDFRQLFLGIYSDKLLLLMHPIVGISFFNCLGIITGKLIISEKLGYLENTDNISGKHGQHGHGQHAKSNPNCNPNPNPDYYFT